MVVQTILATRKVKKEVKVESDDKEKEEKNEEESKTDENKLDKAEEEKVKEADEDIVEETKVEEIKTEDVEVEIKEEETVNPEKTDEAIVKEDNEEGDNKEKDKEEGDKGETKWIEVDEYYVKYRNFSYLHCEWKTEEELTRGDKRMAAKIKRFKQKMATQTNIFENVSIIIIFYYDV